MTRTWTRRLCFRKPDVVIREVDRERRKAEMASMQVQADVEKNETGLITQKKLLHVQL